MPAAPPPWRKPRRPAPVTSARHPDRLYGPPVPGGQRQDVTDENGHAPNTGGAFSTATDLLRFAGALGDGTLMPPPGGGSTALSVNPDLNAVAVVLSNYFLYPGMGISLAQQDRIITQHAC